MTLQVWQLPHDAFIVDPGKAYRMKTIQELREAYGWSHYELAFRAGVRPGTIRDWESGSLRPRTVHIKRLAEVFGVTVDYIDIPAATRINAHHKIE